MVSSSGDLEEKQPPRAGPISKRLVAERGGVVAILNMGLGVAFLLIGGFGLATEPRPWFSWVQLAAGAACLIAGFMLRRARTKRIAEFEAEYGSDAGRQ